LRPQSDGLSRLTVTVHPQDYFCEVNNPVKKMEVAHCKAVALAGLCMSLPIKDWRFRGVFNSFRVALGLLYGARIVVSVMEFSL